MKRSWVQWLGSFAFVVVFALSARAGFKCEPIPPEYRDTVGRQVGRIFCYYQSDLKSDKLPPGAQNARLGYFALDLVHPVLFAVYASEEEAPSDSIVFDLNGDGDLTNDPLFTGFRWSDPNDSSGTIVWFETGAGREIELPIPGGGPTLKAYVVLMGSFMYMDMDLWLRGKVRFGGQDVDAALIKSKRYEVLRPKQIPSMHLLLDVNGDGKFDVEGLDSTGGLGREMFPLLSETPILGALYDSRFDADRMDLTLTPNTGPQGKLDLRLEFASKVKSWRLNCDYARPEDRETAAVFSANDRDFPLSLKAGESRIVNGSLFLTLESGRQETLTFSGKEPLTIKAGETTPLSLGKVKSFDIAVSQKNGNLIVARNFEGANGITYDRITPVSDTEKSDGGKVVIRNAQGKQVGQGTLEYG